eukprot:7685121-Pyramimonas_sp.AAC.1
MRRRCHANPPIGASRGAPYGDTKRVRGVPTWSGGAMRTPHWGLRWSFLWGHETCERRAERGRRCHANRSALPVGP